jgi:hypothetical protein
MKKKNSCEAAGASVVPKQRITGTPGESWECIECKKPVLIEADGTAPMWCAECEAAKPPPTQKAIDYWTAFWELQPINDSAHDYLEDDLSAFSPAELRELEDKLIATYNDRARFDAATDGSFMNLTPHIRMAVGKIYINRKELVALAALTYDTEKHLQRQDPLWDKYEIKSMWAEINRYHKALGRAVSSRLRRTKG